MCLDHFGLDFNGDGDVDFYESYLTYRIMEDAIAGEESFDDFGDETFEDFGDEDLDSLVDEDFEDLDDLWSDDV